MGKDIYCRKEGEYSYGVLWRDDLFNVERIKIHKSSNLEGIIEQIINTLTYEHDQKELESEHYKKTLHFVFMKHNKWYTLTNIQQLEVAQNLMITSTPNIYGMACCMQDFSRRLFLYSFSTFPTYDYLFCECVQIGNEILGTTASGFALKININSEFRCHNKWCNKELVNHIDLTVNKCLFIKGEQGGGDVLAGYCSLKCAMDYRKEMLEHMKQETLKSFRFLIRATRGDIRIMRILRFVHDRVELSLRERRNIDETIEYLCYI